MAAPRPIRLLVADDDEINRAIIAEMVKAEGGYHLALAEHGRQALEQASAARFDVLIFDLHMPYINGDRLIRHLRASQSINATSALFLFTAAADSRSQVPGSYSWKLADAILSKPIRAKDFFAAIREKLGR